MIIHVLNTGLLNSLYCIHNVKECRYIHWLNVMEPEHDVSCFNKLPKHHQKHRLYESNQRNKQWWRHRKTSKLTIKYDIPKVKKIKLHTYRDTSFVRFSRYAFVEQRLTFIWVLVWDVCFSSMFYKNFNPRKTRKICQPKKYTRCLKRKNK